MRLLVVCTLLAVVSAEEKIKDCKGRHCRNIKCWTRYFDIDDPTIKGDFERVSVIKKRFPRQMCRKPTAIDVASVDGISLSDAGNTFYKKDHITGLICRNADQKKCFCRDYKVRFLCNPPFCFNMEACWTRWYDRDNPSGKGDFEHLARLRKEIPGEICADPVAIESRTVKKHTPASFTGQIFHRYSPDTGFICKNSQNKKRCKDYKVRFACPCGPGYELVHHA